MFATDFFLRTVEPRKSTCWEWQGGVLGGGYGSIYLNAFDRWLLGLPPSANAAYAHQIAYILANGSIPPGLWILHRCDNRRCVRPSHLYAGTATQNAQDRERAKARRLRTERRRQRRAMVV